MALDVRLVLYRDKLDTLLNSPSGDVGRYLRRKGLQILAFAKARVGTRTYTLRSSLHMRHLRDTRGQYVKIGSSVPYALLHHEGSRPHLITPKKPQGRLRFVSRGFVVYTHLVRHPGTRPNRYLTDGLKLIT